MGRNGCENAGKRPHPGGLTLAETGAPRHFGHPDG
jgi:hypothetical protein